MLSSFSSMSVSASAENLSSDAQSCDGGSMCLELALEGERLCKAGDCRAGVAFFQAAIQAGTDDLRTLSAIYSQLGNAYFYLGDYNKAMQYHKHDLQLARTMKDNLGEAKASGNLGNTLKVMGKFSEAIQCCKRHLDISRALGDKLSEGRALYNLGNVYHAQGKQLGRVGHSDPGHFPQEVRECLQQAVTYYEENLELMRTQGDQQAMGRACGNLGNTCYLLGDFERAIRYHTERLHIAQEFLDKPAERRANSNLGNSHIFLGQFENAAEHYKRTLALAEELGDAAVEAQACYSLGNTYTLLREYRAAEEYHARHLAAARKLRDRVGEGRACWSLGNAHAALGNHEKALYYAKEHYSISKELGDVLGMATAQMNMSDLHKILGLPPTESAPATPSSTPNDPAAPQTPFNALRVRRQSMEQLSLIQITPDSKKRESESEGEKSSVARADSEDNPAESFFDLLTRCQSERMDEQRATLSNKENRPKIRPKLIRALTSTTSATNPSNTNSNPNATEAMLDMITSLQSARIDSQRAELRPTPRLAPAPPPPAPRPVPATNTPAPATNKPALAPNKPAFATNTPATTQAAATASSVAAPPNDLLDMIEKVQGSRLDSQRTELPSTRARTVPEDDLFAMLFRAQATRMDDQRAAMPLQENRHSKGSKK